MASLDWCENKETCFRNERPTDEAETFYTSLAKTFEGTRRTFFAITGHVRLSVSVPDHDSRDSVEARLRIALQKAWRRIRYDHPTIASKVEWDVFEAKYKKVYHGLENQRQSKEEDYRQKERTWLRESFITLGKGQTGVAFCNSDPPTQRDHATLFLLRQPFASEKLDPSSVTMDLVLRSHHDIIDGIGTLILFNNLLRHAAEAYQLQDNYPEVAFGDEAKNLSPSLRRAVNIASEPTAEQKARLQSILAANDAATKDVEVISVPFKNKTTNPGKNQRAATTLTEAETAEILLKCKSVGATVTQAFHAAIVVAVRDLQERKPQSRQARYINYCLINLRDRCAAPYNSAAHPAAVYHSASGKNLVIDIMIPGISSTAQPAEQLQSEYKSILEHVRAFYLSVQNDPEHVKMVPLYFSSQIPPYVSHACPPIPAPNQSPSVSISSMGVVDKIIQPQHGAISAHDPWVTGDELGTGIGVFLGTWGGRLSLSAGFNEAYHDMGDVVKFLERLKGIVLVRLG